MPPNRRLLFSELLVNKPEPNFQPRALSCYVFSHPSSIKFSFSSALPLPPPLDNNGVMSCLMRCPYLLFSDPPAVRPDSIRSFIQRPRPPPPLC